MSEQALSPLEIRGPQDVEPFLKRVLGAPILRRPGVRHLVAVDRDGSVMRISPQSPKSELDFFLLNAARASCEAILSTGRILREEPDLTHALTGPAGMVDALRRWREEILGLRNPPLLVVLSRGGGLDFTHPAWGSEVRPLLAVPAAEAERVRNGVPDAVRVMSLARANLHGVIEGLETQCGCTQITIEAGPTTALPLYETPCRVDELWLSHFRGDPLPTEMRAAPFLRGAELETRMSRVAHKDYTEESGPWRFALHRHEPVQD